MTGIANKETGKETVVVGAGLAGCEAAWQLARHGVHCRLCEMRPGTMTPAHTTGLFAELVCSNSLGSSLADRPTGLLQEEMRMCSSLVIEVAHATRTPAGGALAVDRQAFARQITSRIEDNERIKVCLGEIVSIPEERPLILATGPLTSDALSRAIARETGSEALFFYDALAPVLDVNSLDFDVIFRASRYDRGDTDEGDYLNCPLNPDEYQRLVSELVAAEKVLLRDFERHDKSFFEGCLPVEELARRGPGTLAFGPLRPVGLIDPRTGKRPHAVVQLRRDNLAGTMYNMVGFQTNLTYPEQKRVFRLIPGLEKAEFLRLGQMHRNTFLKAPELLDRTLQMKAMPGVFVAGQLAGVEGYVGNVAAGWLAGTNAARLALGKPPVVLPVNCMAGALINYLANADPVNFQPMKANFGLLPGPAEIRGGKRRRHAATAVRARASLAEFLAGLD